MEQRAVAVDGIQFRWLETGEGYPLVLVHGIPTNPSLWRHVIPRVDGVRCLAWEMVGYGRSIPAGRDRDISVSRQAEYLLRWMDALGVQRAVLGGHDLGGGVVQILATRHPQRCAGLFLTNSIGYDSWPIPSVHLMRAMSPVVARLPETLFAGMMRTFLRRGHDDPQMAREAFEHHWPPYAESDGAAAFVRQIQSLDKRDTLTVADLLPELRMPALVVWGAADRFQKLDYGRRFARDLSAELRKIPGGKHFTPEDHPHAVARGIVDLLAQVRERG